MAGAMMRQGKIGAIVVGADRIAANGDVANKIGTYTVAILAKEHGIPFYVAAPFSTVDLATPDGSKIPIEQRNAKEVTHIAGKQMVPEGVEVENPAFDVTPAKYVTAIITERGIARAPYEESLQQPMPDKSQWVVLSAYIWTYRASMAELLSINQSITLNLVSKAAERPSAWTVSSPQ